MKDNYIHIVCLDAPTPPDYGGAIDMYYKITSLAQSGKKIILHYFDYHENRSAEGLERFCVSIHCYHRKGFLRSASNLPYIVRSRINKELINCINKDNYPVLLEGIHCSGIIPFLKNSSRVALRMHNEESAYYKNLAAAERNLFRKTYFELESRLLKNFYSKLKKDIPIACLSLEDVEEFKKLHFNEVHFIPAFIPFQQIDSLPGKGKYGLYHGNLSVTENESAAAWLIEKVFSKTDMDFIIAGKKIPKLIIKLARSHKNIQLVSDPGMDKMEELIRNAHINVLPSMNTTGVKLKLLHSLFKGRFCITNSNSVKGSMVTETMAVLAETAEDYIKAIGNLSQKEFSEEDKKNRQQLLMVYNNEMNAGKLNELL